MKRKIAASLTAAALCSTMLVNTAFAVTPDFEAVEVASNSNAGTGQTVEGSSTMVSPTYTLVLPTKLVFAIDPYEMKGQSQIYSAEFPMLNKSDVALNVECAVALTGKTGVTIKDTEEDVKDGSADKLIYMAAEIPSVVAEDVDEGTVTGTYDTKETVAIKNSGTKMNFALAKAEFTDNAFTGMAADSKGSAVFRFTGKVNSDAKWAAEDVSAAITYTFNGMKPDTYTATETSTNGHAYYAGAAQNVLESDGTNDIVVYYTGSKPGSITLTPVSISGTNKAAITQNTGERMVVDDEKVTLKAEWFDALIKNTSARGKGTYRLTVNSENFTITLK